MEQVDCQKQRVLIITTIPIDIIGTSGAPVKRLFSFGTLQSDLHRFFGGTVGLGGETSADSIVSLP
jgi:hypothetical protein